MFLKQDNVTRTLRDVDHVAFFPQLCSVLFLSHLTRYDTRQDTHVARAEANVASSGPLALQV